MKQCKSKFLLLFICLVLPLSLTCDSIAGGSSPKTNNGFRIKPTLQVVTPNSVGVMWCTYNSDKGALVLSTTSSFKTKITQSISTYSTIHKMTVGGLKPSTRYYYQVKADGVTSNVGSFVTAPPKGSRIPFRFIVYGDSRRAPWYEDVVAKYGDNDDQLAVCQSMGSYSPNFLIHVGDYAVAGNDVDEIYNFFDVEKDLLANNPVLPTYGNHEFKGGPNEENTLFDSYLIPVTQPNASYSWYSYDYGNVHILVLNSGDGVFASDNYNLLAPGSAQYKFAEADLQKASADPNIDHIFVSMHVSLYSVANFGDNATLIKYVEPLFKTYRVKAVFVGHEHDYQHMEQGGIQYVLSGGCGSPVLDLPWKGDADDTNARLILYDDVLNYVIVDVNGNWVNCEARKVQGHGNSSSSVLEGFGL